MLHQTLLRKLSTAALGLGLLAGTTTASAATIGLTPNPAGGAVGSQFDVFVAGTGWVAGEPGFDAFGNPAVTAGGTLGGGLAITWDPAIIGLANLNITFPGDQFFGSIVPVISTPGFLSFSVTSFFVGASTPDFDIATLTFDALVAGISPTTINVAGIDVWSDVDGLVQVDPIFEPTTIVVTTIVPEPMSLALVGGAVLGLISLRRKGVAA